MSQNRLHELLFSALQSDSMRMDVLLALRESPLPDCWLAAGFVRNMVWDQLHHTNTPLNDVDVIYFDVLDTEAASGLRAVKVLEAQIPKVNWQIKNQALMHVKTKNKQYTSSEHAMTFWPEKETAVGVRLTNTNELSISAPFGLESLFAGKITYNPKGDKHVFEQRIQQKGWLKIWPKLKVVYETTRL